MSNILSDPAAHAARPWRGLAACLLTVASMLVGPGAARAQPAAPTAATAAVQDAFDRARAAKAAGAQVSPEVIRRAARSEPVDVLITLDDSLQVRQLASMVGPVSVRPRMGRAEYASFLQTQRGLMRALKSDVMLAAADPDLRTLTDYENLPVVHLRIGSARALERLRRQPGIRSIDAVVAVRPALTQSLPLVRQPEVAALGHLGAGTTVAVLDTGVDYSRAAFGSCAAPGGSCKVAVAQDFAAQDYARDTGSFHGTNVAGAVLGVAPGARIAALDVFESNGLAYSNAIVNAINWSITNRATYNIVAINMSLGSGGYTAAVAPGDAWGTAITNAVAAGITVVAASGNNAYSNRISLPAAYSNVVSVGAVYDSNIGGMGWSGCSDAGTAADKVTCFSNSASFLTMLAPGAMIQAAGISMGGTSQASPHVAGAVAVIKAFAPDDTVAEVIARLKLGPVVTDARNGVAKPRLDLMASLALPPATYRLTVARAGSGSGTVSSAEAGISCGAQCSANVPNGDTVTLTALQGPQSQFAGWTGACAGSSVSCTLTMSAARSVTAIFNPMAQEEFVVSGMLSATWNGADDWSVVTDSRYSGTHAMKSGTVADGGSSELRYSGRFANGTITFARRVSSEAGQDELRFYIDDELQQAWSGEMPWGMVAFPVTAGEHTLVWRYVKSASGSAGADAAWIDAVDLPLAATRARPGAVDFDGDGRADIAWRNGTTGANAVWLMDGAARRNGSGSTLTVADTRWRVAGAGDFDGDGRSDLFWRHSASGANAVWFMNGTERLPASAGAETVADLNWQVVGIGDFDADGKADILWRHALTGRNFLWLMNGLARTAGSAELPAVADRNWRVVAVADLDGDGKADIVWRHATSGSTAGWLMDGTTRRSSATIYTVADLGWRMVAADDFDGDGKADLLWRHVRTGANALWLMDGTTRLATSASLPAVVDLGWRVVGVGDVDGDGHADIVWRHASNGGNAVWLMDGTSRRAALEAPNVADTRWGVTAPLAAP